MKRSGLLTFFFSFVPGAGQMYQGYMKRGLSIILLFILPIIVGTAFMPVLNALAAVVYMYSFFDSWNLKSMILDGTNPEDDYLVHLNLAEEDFRKLLSTKNHLIGWGFIILGSCGMYKSFVEPMLYGLIAMMGDSPLRNTLSRLIYSIPSLVVGVVFVMVGLWLIGGSKKNDDFEAYKGDTDDETK